MSIFVEQNLPGIEIGVDADAISLPSPPYVDMSFGMGTDGYPAISMTQYAASIFTKWLTAKTGVFYRLPTETEWEYACRGGMNSSGEDLESQAWYKANSDREYHKVGTKEPNYWVYMILRGTWRNGLSISITKIIKLSYRFIVDVAYNGFDSLII